MREIRRRTWVVGSFPDGNSALMLCAARLRHIASSRWGEQCYLNIALLKELEVTEESGESHDIRPWRDRGVWGRGENGTISSLEGGWFFDGLYQSAMKRGTKCGLSPALLVLKGMFVANFFVVNCIDH